MKGNVRLEPGSIPTVWRKTEISVDQPLSHRCRRKVRIECCCYFNKTVFGLYSLCTNCNLFELGNFLELIVKLRCLRRNAY